MKHLAVFASGGGSNLQSIIDAARAGTLSARIVLVVSNNSGSGAMQKARHNGIPALHLSGTTHPDPNRYRQALFESLKVHAVDYIALAGYMKLLPKGVVQAYAGRIVNIHPALLPAYGGKGMYGMNVHRAVVEAGESRTGATVHFVTERYDEGPAILQESIPVTPQDTPETVAGKVLDIEHRIYPKAIEMVVQGNIRFQS